MIFENSVPNFKFRTKSCEGISQGFHLLFSNNLYNLLWSYPELFYECMANEVNSSRKKSQVSQQIHLFLASFRKLLLSWSRLK